MVLNQLLKITGLIQILCNISINLSYIIFLTISEIIPKESVPRFLPLNILILLCILPGLISLKNIDDTFLKVLLMIVNLVITVLLFVIYTNIFKTYVVNA